MLSFAATPPIEMSRADSSVPANPANFPSTSGSNANRPAAVATLAKEALPPGVPLPPGAQFSVNGQSDPSSNSSIAGFLAVAGMPLRLEAAPGADSLGHPRSSNQQLAPLNVPQPAASESLPLASGAAADWSIVASPNTSATEYNLLLGVACVSASDCWAVGYSINPSVVHSLIEHWDGTSWTIVSPNTSTTDFNVLVGVTCVSASDCWAVGYGGNGAVTQTVIERWDGTSWAIVSSPNTAEGNALRGVTCVSASDCWAVGFFYNNIPSVTSLYQTLIEHWDGTSWTIVNSPNTIAPPSNLLYGVTCVSGSNCWAVGYSTTLGAGTGSATQTLIERWDGTSWTLVSSPNTNAELRNFVTSVACASASNCWAVGYHNVGSVTTLDQTLIEHWDGASWTIVSSPADPSNPLGILYGVTCVSASECWAVGYASKTLVERWDGTSWAIVSSPNPNPNGSDFLYGVTCVSALECWAVGYYGNGGVSQTLTEHYAVSPVQLSAVVSRKVHGNAGTFDVDLPLTGSPGIECRSGGANDDYTLVFTFINPLTSVDGARVTSGTGSVSSNNIDSSDAHKYIVNLTGVTNGQTIKVSLTNVHDASGNVSSIVDRSMSVLVGDTTGDGVVNSTDIAQTKSQSGQFVTSSNFREDLTADGNLNSTDIGLVKSKSGTGLP
ncbi:MAG: hypothetical protein QOG48_2359 [Verrucomicrobiota bacterium]